MLTNPTMCWMTALVSPNLLSLLLHPALYLKDCPVWMISLGFFPHQSQLACGGYWRLGARKRVRSVCILSAPLLRVTVGWLHPSVKIKQFLCISPLCVWFLVAAPCLCFFRLSVSLSHVVALNPFLSFIHSLSYPSLSVLRISCI